MQSSTLLRSHEIVIFIYYDEKNNVNKREMLRYVGDLSQLFGIKEYTLTRGKAKGEKHSMSKMVQGLNLQCSLTDVSIRYMKIEILCFIDPLKSTTKDIQLQKKSLLIVLIDQYN